MKQTQAEVVNLGLKVTPQRLAILKFLKGHPTHPTAENVHHELLKKYPSMSLTTVYKNLLRLVETGKIKELDIEPNKKRFDICTDPHSHFYCRICGNVYDVIYDASSSADNWQSKKNVDGHHVDTNGIHLIGVCKYCEAISP